MSEWISVNERLPEENKTVLLISKGWENDHDDIYIGSRKIGVIEADPYGERNFLGIKTQASDWEVRGWSYFKEPNVIAWMPLPDPYKGE